MNPREPGGKEIDALPASGTLLTAGEAAVQAHLSLGEAHAGHSRVAMPMMADARCVATAFAFSTEAVDNVVDDTLITALSPGQHGAGFRLVKKWA